MSANQSRDNVQRSGKGCSGFELNRREMLAATASAATAVAAATLTTQEAFAAGTPGDVFGVPPHVRRKQFFDIRVDAARKNAESFPLTPGQNNGDEALYADLRGSFSKTLRHNPVGEVRPDSYESFLCALESGDPLDFEQILVGFPNLANRVRLVSPQGAYAFELLSQDGQASRIPPAPRFRSKVTAAEMGELYWYALTRDIPFTDYETHPLIARAVADLNAFTRSDIFPGEGGLVTPGTIFRGAHQGALNGPFISQFLLQPFNIGRLAVDQRYPLPASGNVNNFMVEFNQWLRIQRGAPPSQSTTFLDDRRFISNMRQLGEFVHVDLPVQTGLYAATLLLSFGEGALPDNHPYLRSNSNTQDGFVDFGVADFVQLTLLGARIALTGAWFEKWLVHRRLRPEVFAGRINVHLRGLRSYDIDQEILDSEALERIIRANPTGDPDNDGLLPMAFPEGSPGHPAYPGGHSAFIAASATILKGLFNEEAVFGHDGLPAPVMANENGTELVPFFGPLTVGGELNKLVGNVTHGRDGAGMHYRLDGLGNFTGEEVGIAVLCDYSRTYNEDFPGGFVLTKFDGTKIRIENGEVAII